MQAVSSYREFMDIAGNSKAVLFYVSTPGCGVCKSLKPKVEALAKEDFPRLELYYVDADALPEVRGQLSVYSVPAVLVYFEGRETIREARNFGILELGGKIERYYDLLFGEDETED